MKPKSVLTKIQDTLFPFLTINSSKHNKLWQLRQQLQKQKSINLRKCVSMQSTIQRLITLVVLIWNIYTTTTRSFQSNNIASLIRRNLILKSYNPRQLHPITFINFNSNQHHDRSISSFIRLETPIRNRITTTTTIATTQLHMGQITEKEARNGIDKVVAALRNNKEAVIELGRLESVKNILGYGSPTTGKIAVRFNASFKKGGMGRSSIPLPFGLGQSTTSDGRGVMIGQVKANVDSTSGKVLDCSVFRDLGYGRSFNLKV